MRDMSPAIREFISHVFPGLLLVICHYYFVKDIGKDVFSSYPKLRGSMVSTKALMHISNAKVPEKDGGI